MAQFNAQSLANTPQQQRGQSLQNAANPNYKQYQPASGQSGYGAYRPTRPNPNEKMGNWSQYPAPGKAQPIQQPSQGSPYAPGYGGRVGGKSDFVTADFRDSDRDGVDDRYQSAPGQSPQRPTQPTPPKATISYGDPRGGLAAVGMNERPAPFEMAPAQTPWGQSMNPFAERDAFINQLNQQRMQRQEQFNQPGMPQGSPWMNYGQAAQQAGLGAPQANYADSMIGRLNQSFGGPAAPQMGMSDNPFLGQGLGYPSVQPQPQPASPYQPFLNNQGQEFTGSMSFAPGTPDGYRNQAYGNFANQGGFYQPPAPFMGGFFNAPQQPAQQPWYMTPSASPADKPYVPGHTWLGNQLYNMQDIEPARGPDYSHAISNVYNAAPTASPTRPYAPTSRPTLSRPWQPR